MDYKKIIKDFQEILPGYVLYRLLPDGMVPLAEEPVVMRELFAFQNIVALKK